MNYSKQYRRKRNPEENSNIFSKIFFFYTRKLFVKGFRRDLNEDDIYEVLPSYSSKSLGDRLEKSWNKMVHKTTFSLFYALWNSFGLEFVLLNFTRIIDITITAFLRPKILKKFLSFYTNDNIDNQQVEVEAYLYGISLVLVILIYSVYIPIFFFKLHGFGIKIRIAICSLIYRKLLKMNVCQLEEISVGKIVTLITKDVYDLEWSIRILSSTWSGIARSIVLCIVLYTEIGWMVFFIIGACCFIFVVQANFGILVNVLKLKSSKKTDQRFQATKELLSAIKLIKMHVGSNYLEDRILKYRKTEINILRNISFLLYLQRGLSEMILNIIFYILLFSSIWFGKNIPIETFFLVINILQSFSYMLKAGIPRAFHDGGKAAAALKRIEGVLKAIDGKIFKRINHEKDLPEITLLNLDIYGKNRKILHNVNLSITKGLIIIHGPVGAGKSLLLKTVLQEYHTFTGNLKIGGRISYASQDPWLFPSTLKQNILFRSGYNEERYQEVITSCALVKDLKCLKDGDKTVIAERGSNLSKGQQTRINLARAVYKDCDIYLLDDPLSNLDPLVASFIFENCIIKFLKDKLVVVVTQNPLYLDHADNILILKNGEASLVKNIKKTFSDMNRSKISEIKGEKEKTPKHIVERDDTNEETKLIIQEKITKNKIYEEKNKSGQVEYRTYKKYVELGRGRIFLMVLVLFAVAQVIRSTKDKLQSTWLNTEQKILKCANSNCTDYAEGMETRVRMFYLYPVAVVAILTFAALSAFVNFHFAKIASLNLHKLTLTNIINASINFFDNTFIGNILNRFSRDFTIVDEIIPSSYYRLFESTAQLVGVTLVIASVNPIFLIPSIIFLFVQLIIRMAYLKTGRNLQRLQVSTRSPLIGHLNATLSGLASIRTFKNENILQEEFEEHQNLHISASYTYFCCLDALNLAIKLSATIFLATVIIKFLIVRDGLSIGHVGLVLSQTLLITGTIGPGIRRWAEIENEMTSVERILEYSELKQESKQGVLVENWPRQGEIRYQNVYLSHKNSKNYVLNNISFTIKPKEMVAIVGRTGAGKTSLLNVLMRFYETKGKIFVDDIDIQTVSLEFYRSKISVVLQDPALFTGTLRSNMDPAGMYNDDKIWNVIKTIQMENYFESLDFHIENAGCNLSEGQKQLICLGRAIIANNKIVILDEVTANVDPEIEALIKEIIYQNFSSCTVLIVTHKLDFAASCDKVMVVDEGEIIEYDNPNNLMQNKNSLFNRMFKK